MNREPTVEQIVDRIMETPVGGWCEVRLNPRITRVANLEWLLALCAAQFGRTITIQEHPEGASFVLHIAVAASYREPARRPVERGMPVEAWADELIAVA